MARAARPLGRVELEILQFVADHHPVAARDVADHIAASTGQARTTVVTVLERLRAKGYLGRKRIDRVYKYAPRIEKRALLADLVHDFVSRVLSGSVSPLFTYLAEVEGLSDDELARLKKLVANLEKQRAQEG